MLETLAMGPVAGTVEERPGGRLLVLGRRGGGESG